VFVVDGCCSFGYSVVVCCGSFLLLQCLLSMAAAHLVVVGCGSHWLLWRLLSMAAALFDLMAAALYDSLSSFAAVVFVVDGCCSFGCGVIVCCGSHWLLWCLLSMAAALLVAVSLSAVVVIGCCGVHCQWLLLFMIQ